MLINHVVYANSIVGLFLPYYAIAIVPFGLCFFCIFGDLVNRIFDDIPDKEKEEVNSVYIKRSYLTNKMISDGMREYFPWLYKWFIMIQLLVGVLIAVWIYFFLSSWMGSS